MHPIASATTLLLALAPSAPAQDEARLREAFEGKMVLVKIDMPATDDGVDVHPRAKPPIDYSAYARRLKQHGTAIRAGQSIMVTKVKVKDKHIEFQLGGGGYGTFGDETSPDIHTPSAEKSAREKELEKAVKHETDPARRRAMQRELDDLRREREREDARLRAEVAEAEERRRELIRQRALEAGSRFNIRFKERVPADALTPEAVRAALSEYVEFGGSRLAGGNGTCPPAAAPAPGAVRKGLTLAEVEALLGQARETADRQEGKLRVQTRTYAKDQTLVSAEFVEGVLVRFAITSQ